MKIAVVGLGNIGTTLAGLLAAHRELLGVSQLRLVKCFPAAWDAPDLERLQAGGVEVALAPDERARHAALREADYVFDCRVRGAPEADRTFYESLAGVGVCAQGSELAFGIPFVAGVNDSALEGQRLVHVASCNTHATSTLLRLVGGPHLDDLEDADLVVVRRSEDSAPTNAWSARTWWLDIATMRRGPITPPKHGECLRRST